MVSLHDLKPGQELVCRRTGAFARDAELLLSDEPVATLEAVGLFGGRVAAECADGRWSIARKGWLSSTTLMTAEDRPAEAARFERAFWGTRGELVIPDGRRYGWRRKSWWSMRYAIEKDGAPVLSFRQQAKWFQTSVIVGVEPAAGAVARDLPVLVLFGCHLILSAIAAAQAAAA